MSTTPQDLGYEDVAPIELQGLDPQELESLLRTGYRLTPATMAVKITGGRWIPAPHLLHLSMVVSNAIAKGNQIVLVTMPPRHGKSEFLSVHTPIWHLDTFPDRQIILASYGAELSQEFALKVRDTFLDEDLFPLLRTRLRPDRQRVDNFKTVDNGGMVSIGVGGAATGKGAHLFLIDDFIKNAEEALSESQKKKLWDWFKSTAFTRLEPNATIIILATRWDKKDLIGMILEELAEIQDELDFDPPIIVNFPAIARENDILGRSPGDPLWPFRYDLKALSRIKAILGTYWWEALYQQDPPQSMSGLNLGSKLRYMDASDLPNRNELKTIRPWDLAATPDGGDFTAGPLMHWHKATDRIIISECFHKQLGPKAVENAVRMTAEMDGPGVKVWIEQEPGSAGKALIEHYQDEILPEFDIEGEKSTGPVEVRAQPFLAKVEAGGVWCVKGAWTPKLVEELDGWPDGEHDDIIVAASLGYRKLCKGRFGGLTFGRNKNREGRKPTNVSRFGRARRRRLTF